LRCKQKTNVGKPTLCRTLGHARTCGPSSLTSLSAVTKHTAANVHKPLRRQVAGRNPIEEPVVAFGLVSTPPLSD
jgi:hypothetical protein